MHPYAEVYMDKRVIRIISSVAIFLLLFAMPLLAEEHLMTKIFFDNWLKNATAPLETQINSLKGTIAGLEQSTRELKRHLLTEIKITIGQNWAEIDGRSVPLDVPASLKNNRTMVPVRFIGEVFGAQFSWDDKTRKVTYTLDDVKIELFIGKKTAKLNGKAITLDAEPEVSNGRTLVPLRFVGQYMGATFQWDGAQQTATILQ